MTGQETSLYAYMAELPSLSERQERVRDALLSLRCATNKEIATRLCWPINSVTPRLQELRKQGVVSCIAGRPHILEDSEGCPCKVLQENNRPAIMWKVVEKRW